ncbi:MAG TPA: hypothetical protein VKQ72_05955, partial [Aggregatilineales bacterium]|nr:hypothetical protein [Aggregatilineales bacterium]
QWETLIGLTCVVFAFTVNFYRPQTATIFLSAMLVWQGSLYLSAPYYSLFSIRSKGAERSLRRIEMPGVQVGEGRIARWLLAGAFGIILGIAAALLIPGPVQAPDYSRFQPPDVAPPFFNVLGVFTVTPVPPGETPTITASLPATVTATSAATLTATPGSSTVPSPTATSVAPTATPLPPSATSLPTSTPLPPTSTSVPSATPPTDPPPTATLPPPTTPTQPPTQTQSPHPTPTRKVSTLEPPSVCWIAWNSDTTYPAGSQVSYSGQNWTANVTNRGQPPDNQSDTWADSGPCFVASPTPTPSPTPIY